MNIDSRNCDVSDDHLTHQMIDDSLRFRGLRLKFPPPLNAMFERDTDITRRQMFTRYNIISLIIYDLLIFPYYNELPDVANLTLLVQSLIVTPISIISIVYHSKSDSPVSRELVPVFLGVLSLICGMFIYRQSAIPVAMLYNYSPILTLIYLNVVVSVRFTFAASATAVVFLIAAIDMAYMHEVIPSARSQIMSAITLSGLMTLLGNYKVDKELRRSYLLNARERLQRREIARFAELQSQEYQARSHAADVLETSTRNFGKVAGSALDDFAQVSSEIRGLAEQLTSASAATAQRAASMAAGAQKASVHVTATATAIEELATTAAAVSREIEGSIEMASRAVVRAGQTAATIERLSDAAGQIGAVVTTIQRIAKRTNLLALNAMIEAARAGQAGRGFSVVAEEVKQLSLQAAEATKTIARQIGAIQACTAEAVNALQGIDTTIGEISGIAKEVSVVMRQQATATEEISNNVAGAVCSASEVNGTAVEVQRDADITGSVAARVLSVAGAIGSREFALRAHVVEFLNSIRAA